MSAAHARWCYFATLARTMPGATAWRDHWRNIVAAELEPS